MPRPRKRHSPDVKARVALEAIRGLKTTAQLASEFQVHPVQISQWKRQALDHLHGGFGHDTSHPQRSETERTALLSAEVDRRSLMLDLAGPNSGQTAAGVQSADTPSLHHS